MTDTSDLHFLLDVLLSQRQEMKIKYSPMEWVARDESTHVMNTEWYMEKETRSTKKQSNKLDIQRMNHTSHPNKNNQRRKGNRK